MKWKIMLLLLMLGLIIVNIVPIVSADITVSTNEVYVVGNENYSFASALTFNQINHNTSWIKFSDIGFNITSSNAINLSISYLKSNFSNASQGDLLLRFNANTTGGTVWFNLSGFVANRDYDVFRDSVLLSDEKANASGVISFSSNVWSDHQFDFRDDQGGNTTQLRVTYSYQYVDNFWDIIYNAYGLLSMLGVVIVAVLIIVVLIRAKMEK